MADEFAGLQPLDGRVGRGSSTRAAVVILGFARGERLLASSKQVRSPQIHSDVEGLSLILGWDSFALHAGSLDI